jgi:cytoskeletal protein RodZ
MTTPGTKLKAARLARNLSIEEVSHVTKMRPDRIRELEGDDYSHFPSLAYAKAFLANYARYLKVDLSDVLSSFNTGSPIGNQDYEYLSGTPTELPGPIERKPRTIPVLLMILAAFVVGAAFAWYYAVTFERLGDLDKLAERTAPGAVASPSPKPEPPPARPTSSPTPAPAPSPVVAPTAAPTPTPVPAPPPVLPEPTEPETRRALPVSASEPGAATAPLQTPVRSNIELRPVRKTWVKVTAGGDSGPTVFEDWLYPDANPLRLGGTRYFIQISDPGGLLIFNRDQPVTYLPPGVLLE